MKPRKQLSRRAVLKGAACAAIALPLLEAMQPRRAAAQTARPRRIIFEFKPNGDQIARRMLNTDSRAFEFDEFLQPLETYRNDLLILNKIDKRFSRMKAEERGDNHQQGTMALAPWPQGDGDFTVFGANRRIGYVQGPSVDTVIGDATLLKSPSLPYRQLLYRVGGLQNNITNLSAHSGPEGVQSPMLPETDPLTAYARLFGDSQDEEALTERRRRVLMQQSVLDLVREESSQLTRQIAPNDRQKLEQFSDSLRDLERTLVRPEPSVACRPDGLGQPVNAYADANHASIGAQFQKLIALAFTCDLTRTANFAWAGGVSTRRYAELGIEEPHHDISHISTTDAFEKIRKIHRHLWTQSTGLYETLKNTPDGDGTLWDTTLVVHWNELGQGDTHSLNDQLVVFAGGSDGYFKRGLYRDLNNDVGFSDMLLSCMHYMGLETLDSFGDARLSSGGPVPDIAA